MYTALHNKFITAFATLDTTRHFAFMPVIELKQGNFFSYRIENLITFIQNGVEIIEYDISLRLLTSVPKTCFDDFGQTQYFAELDQLKLIYSALFETLHPFEVLYNDKSSIKYTHGQLDNHYAVLDAQFKLRTCLQKFKQPKTGLLK